MQLLGLPMPTVTSNGTSPNFFLEKVGMMLLSYTICI